MSAMQLFISLDNEKLRIFSKSTLAEHFDPKPRNLLKFIYSEKATKFCEISTSYVLPVKSKVEISQNFVAFSEYINFTYPTTIMARILINIQLKVLIPIQETTAGLVNQKVIGIFLGN